MSAYVYYTHPDGDRMILTDFDEWQSDPRLPPVRVTFTPHHRISSLRNPLLFPTLEQAEQFITDFSYVVPAQLYAVSHLSIDHVRRLRKFHVGV